jgi:Secretion system C-terminal sorting domain
MNAQAFNWGNFGTSPNSRFPTVAEERNIVYSGIAAGIKGIISYVFDNLEAQTSLWNECKALRTDVSTLESALLNGTLIRINTGDQELVASYWVYNNKCYVVVENTSYSSSKNVSLVLPAGYSGTKTSLFSRMPNTLSLAGTTLSGSIAQQAVQVYTIDKVAGATTYYRIKSHQYNKYMWDNVNTLGFGTNAASDFSTHWSLENVDGYIAIKNRSTGHYINIETSQAYAEATAVPTFYWSDQWSLINVTGGYKVIKNRFKSTESLNVGNNLSYVQHTANYPSGYWDGEWIFETVPASAAVANKNNNSSPNFIPKAELVNLSVYPNPAKVKLPIVNIPKNTNISIFTSDGKMITTVKTVASMHDFNVAKWQAGVYLVKIQSGNYTVIKKVIIEK